MLTELRAMLEGHNDVVNPGADELDISGARTSDDVKDIFLDNPNAMVIGAETDPEITKFIEKIPVDEEDRPLTAKEIEELEESVIPILNEAYESEGEPGITDRITSGGYNEFDDEIPMNHSVDGDISTTCNVSESPYDDESDENIIDRITSEAYSEFDDEIPVTEGAGLKGYSGFAEKYSKEGAKEYKNKMNEAKKLIKKGDTKAAKPLINDCLNFYKRMKSDAEKIPDDDWNDVLIKLVYYMGSFILGSIIGSTIFGGPVITAKLLGLAMGLGSGLAGGEHVIRKKQSSKRSAINMIESNIKACNKLLQLCDKYQ